MPLSRKQIESQKKMQELQPRIKETQEKYKNDKEAQAKAMMELYSVHKVNPLSSCLPLLIQLPILIALYQVFMQSLNGKELAGIYAFIQNPGHIDPMFLGWLNLANHNIIMAVIAGGLQYLQSYMMLAKNTGTMDSTAKMLRWQTLYFLPGITIVFGAQFPAGLTLYWIVTTLFGIAQQYYILRKEAKDALAHAK